MTLDDFRGLDPKDAGNWPMPVQLICMLLLFGVLLTGGYFYVWSDQLQDLHAAQAKEEQLKQQFLDKKKQAVNLEAYRQQLLEIQQAFGAMLKQLPNKAEMETLLTEINQAGVGRGLQFELFRPGAEIKTSEFVEQPIDIRISGNYHDLASFVSDVAQLSRIVTLGNIQLAPAKDGQLTMQAVVRTYRVLDEAEMQAIRQAELDAKKKKK
ncbi:MAG: type 4a pilus biogenesis protein PilO [Formivibrio sp.]|nr:type 4a pilus biogenesis protein PilO [Formivibrio sp.]